MEEQRSLAFDKASVRRIDRDGRMHVEITPISKANICGYYGREIIGFDKLGLQPNRLYLMLRDPEELARAAATFNNLQLLGIHTPVSAEDPQKEVVIGSTGTDAKFEAPYLLNSLAIWDAEAIKAIESKEQQDLSASYYYRADMTPGEYEGQAYDGVMRDIEGNHVALVKKGRAGPDVMVADEAPPKRIWTIPQVRRKEPPMAKATVVTLTPRGAAVKGALFAHLLPRLAADSDPAVLSNLLGSVAAGINSRTWAKQKSTLVSTLQRRMKGKLAADADLEDVVNLLEHLDGAEKPVEQVALDPDMAPPIQGAEEDVTEDGDEPDMAAIIQMLTEKLTGKIPPDVLQTVLAALGGGGSQDEDPSMNPGGTDNKDAGDKPPMIDKPAMDAAVQKAMEETEKRVRQQQRELRDAEKAVRPVTGELAIAFDSAADVYKHALKTVEIDTAGVPDAALPAMLNVYLKARGAGAASGGTQPKHAMDAAAAADISKRLPSIARFRTVL